MQFEYDVFLSYSREDKETAQALGKRLRKDGLSVWMDTRRIQPALEKSRTLVICMSPDYFESEWEKLQHHSMLFRDPTNAKRRFLPLLIEQCKTPDIIAQFARIDWRTSADDSYETLLASCQLEVSETDRTSKQKPQADQSRMILDGHQSYVRCVAVTPDGKTVVSGSGDNTLKLWDLVSGRCTATLEGHTREVSGVAVAPDGKRVVSSSWDETLKVWSLETSECVATLEGGVQGNWGVAIAPDTHTVVSGSTGSSLGVWNIETKEYFKLEGHSGVVRGVAIARNGTIAVSSSQDKTLKVWDLVGRRCISTLNGHTEYVDGVTVTPDGNLVVSGSHDETLKVWDIETGHCRATFEGHADDVRRVAITRDGKRIVSVSNDMTTKVWDLATGNCIATLEGHTGLVQGVTITCDDKTIISSSVDQTLRVWDLPLSDAPDDDPDSARYTNAKVVLVGESGAGKTGLALRLAEDRWRETESTHGMNVWPLPLDGLETDGMEREVWLWDFAGQPDYRLVHQLYMDETALALLVVDPQRDNPLEPLEHWEKALRAAVREGTSRILVAARCDRGGFTISDKKIDQHCDAGDYITHIKTSAKTREGCNELKELIAKSIPWDALPWTATSRLFKTLKDAILAVKEEGMALVRISELRQRLQLDMKEEAFEEQDLRTVVGLLEGQGIVKKLDFGDFVLLQPAQINNYASAVVRSARENADEIGCVSERAVLEPEKAETDEKIDFKDMERLSATDEKTLLQAMLQLLFDRSLCARVETDKGTQLVFPSYFKQDRPSLPGQPNIVVTYGFSGLLDEIYATLVVRLHHTNDFEIAELWRYAADFTTAPGERAGLLMAKKKGIGEIQVFFDEAVPLDTQVSFIRYVHEHLKKMAEDITRVRHYVCPHCGAPVKDLDAVRDRLAAGKAFIYCQSCDQQIPFIDLIEERFASDDILRAVQMMDDDAQRNLGNESRELILIGHTFSIAAEAGEVFSNAWSDPALGIHAEIEFKGTNGRRVYLQLKTSDCYSIHRGADGNEVFTVTDPGQMKDWIDLDGPVMLVTRSTDGTILWMNVTEHLTQHGLATKQIVFDGEAFTAANVARMRTNLGTRATDVPTSKALDTWRRKLAFFQAKEAASAGPAELFELGELITECKQKIAELS